MTVLSGDMGGRILGWNWVRALRGKEIGAEESGDGVKEKDVVRLKDQAALGFRADCTAPGLRSITRR